MDAASLAFALPPTTRRRVPRVACPPVPGTIVHTETLAQILVGIEVGPGSPAHLVHCLSCQKGKGKRGQVDLFPHDSVFAMI